MAISASEIRIRLAQYKKAETAVLCSQSYTIGSRTLTRANLKWIQDGIKELEKQLCSVNGNRTIHPLKVVFRDD